MLVAKYERFVTPTHIYSKPGCFNGLRINSLPVQYHANKNAWMTSVIFEKCSTDRDRELKLKSRKILLILDGCAGDPNLSRLTNIRLQSLPPNATALSQSMGMGIIKDLKSLCRPKLVRHILAETEGNLLTPSATAQELVGQPGPAESPPGLGGFQSY